MESRVLARSGGLAPLVGEAAVALEGAREVPPHRLARGLRIAAADRLDDAPVLFLDEVEVGALPAHALGQAGDDAPRDEMAADELQEAREFRIAGRLRDGAVQPEVLVDCA